MTTTLINSEIALSKELGDNWQSTTTGAGVATTLVDSALMAKANDWITDNSWAFLEEEPAGAAAIYDERKISSLDNTTGTLTTLTFAAAPGSGIDYSVHRLFTPSDKRLALIAAAKNAFPALHKKVRASTFRTGNWLLNGDMEYWAAATAPDHWTRSAVTLTQTSTAKLFVSGSYSCALTTVAGYMEQSWSDNDDLKYLRGQTVTFKARGWSDTASSLRLAINDGTTTTYSDYAPATAAWDDELTVWYVTAYIDEDATNVTLRVYHDVAAATDYVDDLRVIGAPYSKVDVSDLGIALDHPHMVSYCPNYFKQEPWIPLRDFKTVTSENVIYLNSYPEADLPMRIEGIGYLDFLASGAVSTLWTATIAVDDPQLRILTAEAIRYLYTQMSLPNFSTGDRADYQKMMGFWDGEIDKRKAKFGMEQPPVLVKWSI